MKRQDGAGGAAGDVPMDRSAGPEAGPPAPRPEPDPEGAFVFAYGSNMLTRRLRERTPSALSIAPGEAPGYTLAFDKLGADGSGKARLVESADPSDRAMGVVFRVREAELALLDRVEGGYRRSLLTVITRWGHTVDAHTYLALESFLRPGLLPFGWYRDLVVAGAREHRLPPEHVLWLECLRTRPDPDVGRRALARRLLDR